MSKHDLGPLENQIMQLMWGEKRTVRQVHHLLRPTKDVAYTTVMTIMSRLVEKGYLDRRMAGKAYVYFPKNSRRNYAKKAVSNVFKRMVNQFGEEAILAFSSEVKKASNKK